MASLMSRTATGMPNARQLQAPKRVSRRSTVAVRSSAVAAEDVPTPEKRKIMNLILAGGIGLPATSLLGPFAYYLYPPGGGGAGGGISAKDILGNDLTEAAYLKTHGPNTRELAQGLKGDPTYLVVNGDGKLLNYGINAVCTHLGCVVPWAAAENKFKCPCHGSQYNTEGKVIRGPAPLSLALAHADINDADKIIFSTWTETDFRTGDEPWWN